jgi:hypothetical protein
MISRTILRASSERGIRREKKRESAPDTAGGA